MALIVGGPESFQWQVRQIRYGLALPKLCLLQLPEGVSLCNFITKSKSTLHRRNLVLPTPASATDLTSSRALPALAKLALGSEI
jgi:hypothetical protein